MYLFNEQVCRGLKIAAEDTEMWGCIRWANWCGGVRTEVSLWGVALRGTWVLDVRSLWSSPQGVRLCSPYDSHNRKWEFGKKIIFSDMGRRVSICKNQDKQIFQMYWHFHLFLETFLLRDQLSWMFSSGRLGCCSVSSNAKAGKRTACLFCSTFNFVCSVVEGIGYGGRKEKTLLYPERSQGLKTLVALLYGDA